MSDKRLQLVPVGKSWVKSRAFFVCLGLIGVGTILRGLLSGRAVPPIAGGLNEAILGAMWIKEPHPFAYWKNLFLNPGPKGWIYESPLLEPLHGILVGIFGLSFHSAAIAGILAFIISALLTMRICHANRRQLVGVLAVFYLTFSPLQIGWSIFGFRAAWALPHVLLTAAIAVDAGRRKSLTLAVLSGVVAFLSIYNHDSARIALALAPLCLVFSSTKLRDGILLAAVSLIAICGLTLCLSHLAGSLTVHAILWPYRSADFAGYDESSFWDFLVEAVRRANVELPPLLRLMFLDRHAAPPAGFAWNWTPGSGGYAASWQVLLGIIGMVTIWRNPRSAFLWFAIFAGAVSVSILSCTQSRRLLIVDASWGIFFAEGLDFCFQCITRFVRFPGRLRMLATSAVMVALACYSIHMYRAVANFYLQEQRPWGGYWSPQGLLSQSMTEGCVDDVVSCPRCMKVAEHLAAKVRGGSRVIVFNTIPYDAGTPGGLSEYLQIKAWELGDPLVIQNFYSVLDNWEWIPRGRSVLAEVQNVRDRFSKILTHGPQREIVWYFDRPNAWEKSLASQLVELGGRLETSFDSHSLQIRTTQEIFSRVLDLFERRFDSSAIAGSTCTKLVELARSPLTVSPWYLSFDRNTKQLVVAGQLLESPAVGVLVNKSFVERIGVVAAAASRSSPHEASVVTEIGEWLGLDQLHTGDRMYVHNLAPAPVRSSCVAFIGDKPIVVNPDVGTLHSPLDLSWLPPRQWIGVGSNGQDRIALASADQFIELYDYTTKNLISRSRAVVLPARTWGINECAPVFVGNRFYGVVTTADQRLQLFSDQGINRGSIALGRLAQIGGGVLIPHAVMDDKLIIPNYVPALASVTYAVETDPNCQSVLVEDHRVVRRRPLLGFEGQDSVSFQVDGEAFGAQGRTSVEQRLPGQVPYSGFEGLWLANSFHGGDFSTGSLRSTDFQITLPFFTFRVGGGNKPGVCEVRLLVDGQVVKSATGEDFEGLRKEAWNVSAYVGKLAKIEIVDHSSEGWGHILADSFEEVGIQ